MAENERWGFYVSRGELLVIALARSFLFAEKKIFHIPPDLVVDQWAFDGESSSHRPSLLQDDVWTTLCPRISEKITLALSIAWHFTTKSGGICVFFGGSIAARIQHGHTTGEL